MEREREEEESEGERLRGKKDGVRARLARGEVKSDVRNGLKGGK